MAAKFVIKKVTCVFCKTPTTIRCPEDGHLDWSAGQFIQDAMPELTADERELLISQVCPKCFDMACAEPPDDEDDGDSIIAEQLWYMDNVQNPDC